MAFTFVQAVAGDDVSSSLVITPAKVGNLIVLCMFGNADTNGAVSNTPNAISWDSSIPRKFSAYYGWALQHVWGITTSTAATTITVSAPAQFKFYALEFDPNGASVSVDTPALDSWTGVTPGGGDQTWSKTTASDNELGIAHMLTPANLTPVTGYTALATGTVGVHEFVEYKVDVGTAGTKTIGWTADGSAESVAVASFFKLGSGGGGSTVPTVTSCTPNNGYVDSTQRVALAGTNLASPTSVTVSGTGVTATVIGTPSSIAATIDFGIASTATPGARTVTYTTAAGSVTFTFTVLPRGGGASLTGIFVNGSPMIRFVE